MYCSNRQRSQVDSEIDLATWLVGKHIERSCLIKLPVVRSKSIMNVKGKGSLCLHIRSNESLVF